MHYTEYPAGWRLSTFTRDRRRDSEISVRIHIGINPRFGVVLLLPRERSREHRGGVRRIMDDQRKPIAEPFEIN